MGKYTMHSVEIQDFCFTQILREINFEDSRSAKTAVCAILEALNFVNLVNISLQKVKKNNKKSKFRGSKCVKWLILDTKNPQI